MTPFLTYLTLTGAVWAGFSAFAVAAVAIGSMIIAANERDGLMLLVITAPCAAIATALGGLSHWLLGLAQ